LIVESITGLPEIVDRIAARKGITQRDIAATVGVAPETLSRWKRHRVMPSGDSLLKLLAGLQVYEPRLRLADLIKDRVA
jgi:transcriptional regulator with XRE-family HTH domain